MKRLLTSCFGLGRLPGAPGTWGSLPVAVLFGLLGYFHASPTTIFIVMAAVILVSSAVCVGYAPSAIAATGKDDPREVVVDEVAGQAVTFLASPLLVIGAAPAGQVWLVAAGGFALFRVFDIIKPWPIRKLERLPKGWGILADDLLAGVYAWIVLQVCVRVFLG
ncbi:MAG: phosphatidylglycerophosphatase A [Sedimentisphaerales bacterium]